MPATVWHQKKRVAGDRSAEIVFGIPGDLHLVAMLAFKTKRELLRWLSTEEAELSRLEVALHGSPEAKHCIAGLMRIRAARRALDSGAFDEAVGYARELPHIKAALRAEGDRLRAAEIVWSRDKGGRRRAAEARLDGLAVRKTLEAIKKQHPKMSLTRARHIAAEQLGRSYRTILRRTRDSPKPRRPERTTA